MDNPLNFGFQYLAIMGTGLVAGLMYSYDCSVMKGLGNLQDDIYLQSFQSINKAIQNPYFFLSFMGSLLVLPIATWRSYDNSNPAAFYLLLAATIVYATGVFAVTIFGNVPLNEQLAKYSLSTATDQELAAIRRSFEQSWNTFHRIRTVASIVCFGLVILSIFNIKT